MKKCSVDNCGNSLHCKSLCKLHYERKRTTGSVYRNNRPTLLENFESKIAFIPFSTCHWWVGFLDYNGYGRFRSPNNNLAHRFSYLTYRGDIGRFDVLHTCDNPSCVNPDHLWLGTHLDNMRDMENKGRRQNHYGSENGFSKLTESDVLQIRALEGFLSRYELADKFKVSASTICSIVNRKAWLHI